MSIAAGNCLGPYKISALLGAGGMGEVYRAHDDRLGRDVAIKVLREEATADPELQRRFAVEARSASALNHPNILTVFDVGMDGGIPFIVTEFVEGELLRDLISRGPVPVPKALQIATQVASGLAAAHQAGIIHRDLKPANLMVNREGLVKILDFGLAKSIRQGAAIAAVPAGETGPGIIVGTATYMSPEQVKGESLDHRTDQFSFGLVLYEMLTGKPAFARSSAISTMAAIVEERARPIAELNPSIPAPLRWSIDRCLAKSRADRYASTADLHLELENIRVHLEEAGSGQQQAPPPAPPTRKRHLWPVLLSIVGLLTGAVVTEFLLVPPSSVDLAACHLRPVAVAAQFARSPAWSPDGRSLAYTAVLNGVRQVFVRELGSPMSGQITASITDCERPFWSPDQSRIFYFTSGTSGPDLYSIGAVGGAPELLVPNASTAAIAPDGKTLAFLRADPTGKEPLSLWTGPLGGGDLRRFTARPFDSTRYQSGYLSFSPGGKGLGLFLSRWDGHSEFWMLPWPGGQPRGPFFAGEQAYPFAWMPDNRSLVFGGIVPGSMGADLRMMDSRNGRLRPLSVLTKDAVEASVSPDGARIAFVASEDNFDLLSVALDGSSVQALGGTPRGEYDPTWAPGGNQLAYCTDRTGPVEIWLRSIHEGSDRPLVTARDFGQMWIASFADPNISPDGRRLAYSVAGTSGHSIFISNLAGGKPMRLSADNADERSPSWNGASTWIAYLRNTGGSWALVKAPSGGGSLPTVLREGCLPFHPKWNRRLGHWIACVTADGLTLISEDGRETQLLSRDRWLVFGWTPDGTTMYGVKQMEAGRRVIASIEIATRTEKQWGELHLPVAAQMRGFTMAPDGKSFATSASHPSGDLWILEGFEKPGLTLSSW